MAAISLTREQAKRYLLTYHGLLGDFRYEGKDGILSFITRVGSIQYDPLNVVGTNPELVLQSRIPGFHPSQLWELLYEDRELLDYWDKNMCIFPVEDWPFFSRYRAKLRGWCDSNPEAVDRVRGEISERGVLCSGDLQYDEKVNWPWGPTRLSRAALEGMYHAGQLVIHHKTKTRKYYDFTERVLPQELYGLPDPFPSDEAYYEWHVLRRIGSVGMLWNRPSDAWLGIMDMKTAQRNGAFARLQQQEKIVEVNVDGIQPPLYLRSQDLGLLNQVLAGEPDHGDTDARVSILAPLDNLLWDRNLIQQLFDFEYRWEVYKPAAERKYGYYVLPVLYGDNIVARFEPDKHRNRAPLSIKGWWWEQPGSVTEAMTKSAQAGLERFAAYLGTQLQQESLEAAWLR